MYKVSWKPLYLRNAESTSCSLFIQHHDWVYIPTLSGMPMKCRAKNKRNIAGGLYVQPTLDPSYTITFSMDGFIIEGQYKQRLGAGACKAVIKATPENKRNLELTYGNELLPIPDDGLDVWEQQNNE